MSDETKPDVCAAPFRASLPYPDGSERMVWIYVPVHGEGERLPVIYMTDGQNLFDENSTPYGSWQVMGAVNAACENGLPGAVIVGIDNGGERRDCELTPAKIGEVQLRDMLVKDFVPEGEIFDEFLTKIVMPFVCENFPVRHDKQSTAVCGSSSGGLMAFFTAMEHPDLFECAGVFSPAFLCYKRGDWQNYLTPKISEDVPYLYIYTGAGDILEGMIYKSVEVMYDLLTELCYPPDMMSEVVLLENKHNEEAWREIFPDFLHTFLHAGAPNQQS